MTIISNRNQIGLFFRKPVVIAGVIAVTLFLLIYAVREGGILQRIELSVYDFSLRLLARSYSTDSPIVLIEITEKNIQDLGRWPLTDEDLAILLQSIFSYNPRAVGLDIYRDHPVPPGTELLDRVLTEANIIGITKVKERNQTSISPPTALLSTERVGFSDILVDLDGVVRRGLLFLDDGNNLYYAFSLRLALEYLQSKNIRPQSGKQDASHMRLGPVTLKPLDSSDGFYVNMDNSGYQYLLDHRDSGSAFQRFNYADILSGNLPPGSLTGKIVIVGVVADSVKDYFQTPHQYPSNSSSSLSGMEQHARMTSQLIRAGTNGDSPLSFFSDAVEYSWVLHWTIAGAFLTLLATTILRFALLVSFGLIILIAITLSTFASGYWLPLIPAILGWMGSTMSTIAYLSGHERRQRRQLMSLFSKHVSTDVAEEIWRHRDRFVSGGRIENRQIVATVLFSDLADFTPAVEGLAPNQLMDWLNQYMDRMANLVMMHGGVIDDYYGDAIKANFGAPLIAENDEEIGNNARQAADCALSMRRELQQLNLDLLAENLPPIRMRIGICTGPMVAGCLGSSHRMKYTTIGDSVNTAARLEAYSKELRDSEIMGSDCRILAPQSTVQYLNTGIQAKQAGTLTLKGKSEEIKVYSI